MLEVEDLQTYFYTRAGLVKAVDGVSFSLKRGETLAIVGESGCGKSVTALSLMRLVADPPGRIVGGSVKLDGRDLVGLDEATMRGDPRQRHLHDLPGADDLAQPGDDHRPADRRGADAASEPVAQGAPLARTIEMLQLVGIPEPKQRVKEYPHQLSGGMRQRAMIAMALACNPKVLIADEPTSALDVTIQAQILDLIGKLQRELGTAVILITHDLGVVAETAERVIVMYAGRKVEEAPVGELFARPLHPYTRGLMNSIPRLALMRREAGPAVERLQEIPGMVPALSNLPQGCTFAPRCAFADDTCRAPVSAPTRRSARSHWAACWHSDKLAGAANG